MNQDKLNLLEKIRILGHRDPMDHVVLSRRLQYLVEHYGDKISQSLRMNENILLSGKEAVVKFASFDPMLNKSSTQWLIQTYLKKKIKFHDLSKAKIVLAEFYEKRKHLPTEGRDINQYEALSDIVITLRAYGEVLVSSQGREKRRQENKKAYRESIILWEHNGFKAVAPMTEFASHWWGRGTRWCTASTQSSMFYYYHTNSPLLIFIMPNGEKYQMFISKAEKSFMDANDKPVSLEFIEKNWSYLSGFINWGMTLNTSILSWFPMKFRTQDFCLKSLAKNGCALMAFPEEFITREICLQAVSQDGRALKGVPQKYLDKEMFMTAIEQNPMAIKDIMEKRDMEICWALIKRGGWMLSEVPIELRTHDLCLHAVSDCGYALQNVPLDILTEEMCLNAVSQDGMALVDVPSRFLNDKIYLLALENGCWALNMIPQYLRTREACLACVGENGCMLEYVPESILDTEMCRVAMTNNMEYAYRHIPEHIKDRDFCKEMVKLAGWVLEKIPGEFQDEEICALAVKTAGMTLSLIKDKWITESMCYEAIVNAPLALEFVPERFKTKELCREATRKTDIAIKHVPNIWREELSSVEYYHESEWSIDMLDNIRDFTKNQFPLQEKDDDNVKLGN